MTRKTLVILLVLICLMLFVACSPAQTSPTPQANMPNPASVYCEKNGGKLELRTDAAGAVSGVCVFSDKSECEEWAYFRSECKPGDSLKPTPASSPAASLPNPASVYCEKNSGKLELRTDAAGAVSGVCVFLDKSECEEWAYFRSECKPGNSQVSPIPTPRSKSNLSNPASAYCEQQGNKLKIATADDGSQNGVCIFPNGSTCDEWAYFRGECGPTK
jgi:putative hemolysin